MWILMVWTYLNYCRFQSHTGRPRPFYAYFQFRSGAEVDFPEAEERHRRIPLRARIHHLIGKGYNISFDDLLGQCIHVGRKVSVYVAHLLLREE